jgi:uncharacterized protein YjbI with pentapeptide repeats
MAFAMAFFEKGLVFEIWDAADEPRRLTIEGNSVGVQPDDSTFAIEAFAKREIEQLVAQRAGVRAKHLEMLTSMQAWNKWRKDHPEIRPMLGFAELAARDLQGYDFSYADLCQANLKGAHLKGASFHQAVLARADLTGADLTNVNFCRTDLYETNFTGAKFIGSNLQGVQFVRSNLTGAEFDQCSVYGMSAWDIIDACDAQARQSPLKRSFKVNYTLPAQTPVEGGQSDLERRHRACLSGHGQSLLVDDVELASFSYQALNGSNLSRMFNAAGKSWVLLLGRFTGESNTVLHQLGDRLRRHNLIPIIFDFPKPERRDLAETVVLIAGLSAFVIVDITDVKSTPLEMQAIASTLSVPIFPIMQRQSKAFSLLAGLKKFPWVMTLLKYSSREDLIAALPTAIILPAQGGVGSMQAENDVSIPTRDTADYQPTKAPAPFSAPD